MTDPKSASRSLPVVIHERCARDARIQEGARTAAGGTIASFVDIGSSERRPEERRTCSLCGRPIEPHQSMLVDDATLPVPKFELPASLTEQARLAQDTSERILAAIERLHPLLASHHPAEVPPPADIQPIAVPHPRLSPPIEQVVAAERKHAPVPIEQLVEANMLVEVTRELVAAGSDRAQTLAEEANELVARVRARVAAGPERHDALVITASYEQALFELTAKMPRWDVVREGDAAPFCADGVEYGGMLLRSRALAIAGELQDAHGRPFGVVMSTSRPLYCRRWRNEQWL